MPETSGAVRLRWPFGPAGLDSRRLRQLLRERADTVVLVAIVGVAAAVRFATLDAQSFDHDESVTAVRVLHPGLLATLSAVVHIERSPPLYYLLLWAWSKLAGTGQVDLRVPSAIVGTLTVPLAFLVGRELASRRAGLIAAALVALNPFLVWYSQEARSYALLAFFSTLALFLFARALHSPSRSAIGLWAGASVLALCSHYFAVFLIVPEGVWLVCATRPRRWAVTAVGATAAAGLALLPLAVAQEGTGRLNGFTSIPVLTRAWETLVQFVASVEPDILAPGTHLGSVRLVAVGGSVGIAVAALLILWHRSDGGERRGAMVAASIGATCLALPLGLALAGVDYVEPRNLIGSLVPLLVAAGVALGTRRGGLISLAAAGACCALFAGVLTAVGLSPRMQRPDWRGAAQAIGPATGSRVIVGPQDGRYALAFYLDAKKFRSTDPPVRAREVDLLTVKHRPGSPGRPFRLVATREVAGEYHVWRYRAPRAVLLWPGVVRHENLIHQPSSDLVSRPRGQRGAGI